MTDLTLIIPAKKKKNRFQSFEKFEYLNHKIIVSLPKNDLKL